MAKDYKFIPVTKDEDGSRIDRVIHKKYPYLNQGRIEKALRNKLITVNQAKVSSNHRLVLGDHVQILSMLVQEEFISDRKHISKTQIKLITDNIIYRDGDLLVINKPAGIAVQGGSKIKISIDDIMPAALENMETWYEHKPTHKLVHRLDKETSGILLIALNNKTAQELALAFKERNIEKKYLAVLTGEVKTNNGQISTIIDKHNKQYEDDNAITNYRVLAKNSLATLVEFKPVTGKTHQLRLHALELGFPILGDSKYDESWHDRKMDYLHLHAAEIIIPHQGSMLKIKADVPEYFQDTLKQLRL